MLHDDSRSSAACIQRRRKVKKSGGSRIEGEAEPRAKPKI